MVELAALLTLFATGRPADAVAIVSGGTPAQLSADARR